MHGGMNMTTGTKTKMRRAAALRRDVEQVIAHMRHCFNLAEIALETEPRMAAMDVWGGFQDLGRVMQRLSDGAGRDFPHP